MRILSSLAFSSFVACAVAACGNSSAPARDLSTGPAFDFSGVVVDLASSQPDDLSNVAPGADLACMPTVGATCPPTAGNCKGIGKPCTKNGGECTADTNVCDKDQSSSGVGICIKIASCTVGMHQCGAGASCCATSDTFFIPVCLPNQCLSTGCNAE